MRDQILRVQGPGGRPDIPEGIHNRALHLPYMFIIPIPSLRVDRLPNTTEHTQAAQIVILDVVFAEAAKKPDCGGGGIELGQLVLLDGLPVARRCGVYGGGFKDSRRNSICKRAVDDVSARRAMISAVKQARKHESSNLRMTGDPTNISHASELVVRMYIEHIFYCQRSAKKIATSCVYDTLGIACGSRGLHAGLDWNDKPNGNSHKG